MKLAQSRMNKPALQKAITAPNRLERSHHRPMGKCLLTTDLGMIGSFAKNARRHILHGLCKVRYVVDFHEASHPPVAKQFGLTPGQRERQPPRREQRFMHDETIPSPRSPERNLSHPTNQGVTGKSDNRSRPGRAHPRLM